MRGAFLCLDAVAPWCLDGAGAGVEAGAAGAGYLPGERLFSWTRVYVVGLALGVKYVTQFTAFQFGCFWEPLYSYMCCQGDLVKEV